VVNLALAAFFLLFLVPLVLHFAGHKVVAQVVLVLAALPLALLTVLCLASAARPGSLGRLARKMRRR